MKFMKGTAEPMTRAEAQGTQKGTADKHQRVWKKGKPMVAIAPLLPLNEEAGWG